ncbi:hypothetical protein FD723_40570 (plasmid) [Nostoc sp. C052]|uniref:hypothetical protein n=1 Tax=Nostoc sp. C052 TaxID=2576902 RepID=UPI0015C409A7|nr:hypothetical protein [Nostoc sp. C052]QLE46509.1 hypothetical protein FD723_40570 [Nostoc sp. C052]
MPQQVRISDDTYDTLREISFSLESEYMKATPTIQDLVSVALERLIEDWEHPDSKDKLLKELLEHRQMARSRMGNRG